MTFSATIAVDRTDQPMTPANANAGARASPPAAAIPLDREAIAEFCQAHHIRKLALFGSVLRDDFGTGSDVDVLVEFEVGHTPGLAFFTMQEELGRMLGRTVDLNTVEDLSPHFRESILREAQVQYAA
jgi:predicted nucleotidyltransferase